MFFAKQHSWGEVTGYEVGIAPAGRPIKSVYLYQVDSFLVDTGPRHLQRKIDSMIDSHAIEAILLTHHHEDHSGNSACLSDHANVPVYIHAYGGAKLARGFNIMPYQHILFGRAPKVQTRPCPDRVEGENLTFKALHTPGHSKDHTVFYAEKEGWLFSGDLYVGEKIQFFRVDEQIGEQIASLKQIAALDFDHLFCAHRPSMKDGRERIQRKLDFLVSFHQQVQELNLRGAGEKEIVQRMRVKRDLPVRLFTMGNASFANMVRSSLRWSTCQQS